MIGDWPTPLKNDGVKVSWDDELPKIIQMLQTTNQLVIYELENGRWSGAKSWDL